MPLSTGTRLVSYEIVAAIGAGGMGEVYRARDATLNRDVALKVLPPAFILDPDRLARFKREAQVLASLNHQNIGAIYGFEESSAAQALVLELIEGPTLADRVEQGPLPLAEAIPIARPIADALEAAHDQGIIHRDLKPANIKLRPDGTVKVLDFGLAKLQSGAVGQAGSAGGPGPMESPTLTTPAMMTGIGTILGTAAYMSPEQAKGRPADKRSDVWAFGSVFYEMLTGRRAFEGEDVAYTLANVLKTEPEWHALPPDVPLSIRTLLKRCLAKDRRHRVADIAVAQFVLSDPASLAAPVGAAAPVAAGRSTPRWRSTILVAAATLLTAVVVALGAWRLRPSSAPAPVARFAITRAPGQQPLNITRHLVGISRAEPVSDLVRWIAYSSTPASAVGGGISPSRGVYIQPVPATGARYQIPKQQGLDFHPVWGPKGDVLFYVPSAASGLMAAVGVTTQPGVVFGSAESLPARVTASRLSNETRAHDILPDGRFVGLVGRTDGDSSDALSAGQMRVVINWFEELKQRVPR